MPNATLKICAHAGCGSLVRKGRCREHTTRIGQQRGSASQRGYNYKWQKASKRFLRHNPLCVECDSVGLVTASTVVDHIIPHRQDQTLFWDSNNWQAMCKHCHDAKSRRGE